MIAGLAAAADLISSWSEEEDEEEEEGSQLRRMRDRLAQNIKVRKRFKTKHENKRLGKVFITL